VSEEFTGVFAVSRFGVDVSETFRFIYLVLFSTYPNLYKKFVLPPYDSSVTILRDGD
jgi:hypothetical protein